MSHNLEGKIIDGKYQIEEVWREEPSGFLCSAVHMLRSAGVVLKVLPANSTSGASDFDAEVKMLSSVSHPALLSVRDCSTSSDGTRYCVFEPFSGESLAVKLADQETFSAAQSLEITAVLAEALLEVGKQGYLHGAIEPENIILGRGSDGELKIKLIGFGNEVNSLDRVSFSAPESISGLHSVSPASDVYALAAILYRLLVGRYPFSGSTVGEVATSHASIEKLTMPGIPRSLAAELVPVMSRALSMNPDMRPAMEEFAEEIRSAENGLSSPGGSFLKTAVIVAVGIAVLSGVFIYMTYMGQADPDTAPIADEQGMPVQPLSPATGVLEANLIGQLPPPVDTNETADSSDVPGGDSYNPWAGGGPPPGAPSSVPPGGERVVIEPGNSQFMPADDQPYYVTPQAPRQPTPTPTPTPRSNGNNQD
jgi:serine/threonine protein kinase